MWLATADLDGADVVEHFLLVASHNDLRLSPDATKLLTDRYLESTEEET